MPGAYLDDEIDRTGQSHLLRTLLLRFGEHSHPLDGRVIFKDSLECVEVIDAYSHVQRDSIGTIGDDPFDLDHILLGASSATYHRSRLNARAARDER